MTGVNVTLGLPIIRTSVDHGTAFGKAGKGTADQRSLLEATQFAIADSRAELDMAWLLMLRAAHTRDTIARMITQRAPSRERAYAPVFSPEPGR